MWLAARPRRRRLASKCVHGRSCRCLPDCNCSRCPRRRHARVSPPSPPSRHGGPPSTPQRRRVSPPFVLSSRPFLCSSPVCFSNFIAPLPPSVRSQRLLRSPPPCALLSRRWALSPTAGRFPRRLRSPSHGGEHFSTAGRFRARLGAPPHGWALPLTAGRFPARLGAFSHGWSLPRTAGRSPARLGAPPHGCACPRTAARVPTRLLCPRTAGRSSPRLTLPSTTGRSPPRLGALPNCYVLALSGAVSPEAVTVGPSAGGSSARLT